MNKTVKKIISTFLGVLFVVLVVCGIVVATYVFNTPSKDGESRQFIMGNWIDADNNVKFVFSEEGDFYMYDTSDGESLLAKGFFKINEDDHAIKLLLTEHSSDKDFGMKLWFFSTITYTDLKYPSAEAIEYDLPHDKATCKFLFQDSDAKVYKCERDGEKKNFYGKKIDEK